jgi:diadenosine tetraphosphate (Ap4A) HIT family hydrolase
MRNIEFAGIERVPNEIIYLMGCRSFEQFCGTIRSIIDPPRFCPFCKEERARRKQQEVHGSAAWMLLRNEYPHRNTKQMWLIVPRHHIFHTNQIGAVDWVEIGNLFQWCLGQGKIQGGGVMFRFGEPRLNVGTVPHLHINIIEPIPGKEYRPPFAKKEPEHAEDYERMLDFLNQLIERGGRKWLFSPVGIEATQPKVA